MRMSARWGGLFVLVGLLVPTTDVAAQCATCGNPAFVGANRDISQTLSTTGADLWRSHAALLYGIGGSGGYFQDTAAIENLDEFQMTMHVVSLLAGAEAPWGTGVQVSVPWARLDSDRQVYGESSDQGLGDVELRLGQDVIGGFGLRSKWLSRAVVSVGAVMPTGVYVERKDSVQNQKVDVSTDPACQTCGDFCPDHCAPVKRDDSAPLIEPGSSRYLSIGRGSWWLVLDGEMGGSLHDRVGWYLGATWRKALTDAPDGFGWGGEQRVGIGFSGVIWPQLISAQFLTEYDRREMSTDGGVLFDNGGGHFVTVSPTIQAMLGEQMTLSVTWRQPVHRDVIGVQVVEGPSVWVSLGGRLSFGGKPAVAAALPTDATATAGAEPADRKRLKKALAASPGRAQPGAPPGNKEIADLLVPGKTTIVDYWADWCQPCVRLGAELKEFAASGREDVVLRKVDATNWSEAQWVRLLPDVPTMPAVDIYGPDGKLIVRLRSDGAFDWRNHLPAAP